MDNVKLTKKQIINDYFSKIVFWSNLKLLNFRMIASGELKDTIPMWNRLAIELHSDCNRNCFFCARYADTSGIRKYKNGSHVKRKMPTWKVKDIINQVNELGYSGSTGFHRLSEPLLDDRYVELASYAKIKGLKVMEDTNADVLEKNPDLIKKIDGLVSRLQIGLYDYKNNAEKKQQMSYWKKKFKKTGIVFSLAAEYPIIRINSKFDLDGKLYINDIVKHYPCFWPMYGLWIRYDGEISLCCEDDQCNFGLGNVFDTSIKDIWLSKKHIEIAKNLKKFNGRLNYELCRKCNFDGFIPVTGLNKKIVK